MSHESDLLEIGDYAIIGDCRSAALISRTGSIDWLCWPRFDSPSLFGALLDHGQGGRFAVCPTAQFSTTRCYLGDTNVLETTFRTATGVVRLIDLMPVDSEENKRHTLWAEHQILRIIECVEGEVEIEVVCAPRPDYGRTVPRLRLRGALGFYFEDHGHAFILRSEIPLKLSEDHADVHGKYVLRHGERLRFSAVYSEGEPAFIPPLGELAEQRLQATLRWWEEWAARCTYEGPYRDAVMRSALCLKLMSYSPSGAMVAAPTTSLPEKLGGVRNWDYRYCWVRDASLTLQSLFDLGYRHEAEAFLSWLLHTTQMSQPELQILYGVYGETRLPEQELDHLAGFAGSRPVRIGNDARAQLQLDIYGEVLDAVYAFICRGGRLDRATTRMLRGFGETVCRRWQEPDEGIWEIRGGRLQHTYSKVMCWVALDRLIKLSEQGHLRIPLERFTCTRDAIREAIERHGYNEEIQSYVSVFGGSDVDASLLLLARHGYADPAGIRIRQTCALVHRRLGRDGLLYRYLADNDGLPPGEGAFGICSFWAVDCKALQGDVDGASQIFESVLSYANDVGLFAEEIDPDRGTLLGNFPQAFTHVGLIDAALTLAQANMGKRREPDATQPKMTGTKL
ncbi:MAG: glycoside hydrolase family 15 protein [Sulfuriferula sp.]